MHTEGIGQRLATMFDPEATTEPTDTSETPSTYEIRQAWPPAPDRYPWAAVRSLCPTPPTNNA